MLATAPAAAPRIRLRVDDVRPARASTLERKRDRLAFCSRTRRNRHLQQQLGLNLIRRLCPMPRDSAARESSPDASRCQVSSLEAGCAQAIVHNPSHMPPRMQPSEWWGMGRRSQKMIHSRAFGWSPRDDQKLTQSRSFTGAMWLRPIEQAYRIHLVQTAFDERPESGYTDTARRGAGGSVRACTAANSAGEESVVAHLVPRNDSASDKKIRCVPCHSSHTTLTYFDIVRIIRVDSRHGFSVTTWSPSTISTD